MNISDRLNPLPKNLARALVRRFNQIGLPPAAAEDPELQPGWKRFFNRRAVLVVRDLGKYVDVTFVKSKSKSK